MVGVESPSKLLVQEMRSSDRWVLRDLLAQGKGVAFNDLVSFAEQRIKRLVVVFLSVCVGQEPEYGDQAAALRCSHVDVCRQVEHGGLLDGAGSLLCETERLVDGDG